MRILPNIV